LPASAGFTIYEEEEEEKAAFDVYRDQSQGVESQSDTATIPGFGLRRRSKESTALTCIEILEEESRKEPNRKVILQPVAIWDALGALTAGGQGRFRRGVSLGSLTLELNEGGGVSSGRCVVFGKWSHTGRETL
jgi:hypothetical protein